LRADPEPWAEHLAEGKRRDGTVMDGLAGDWARA
jgi:hypothetical protein